VVPGEAAEFANRLPTGNRKNLREPKKTDFSLAAMDFPGTLPG
jgi:hypothetical protein